MASDDNRAGAGPPATPGWYPDPWFPGRRRFFDGATWTAHSFPADAGPGGPAVPVVSAPPPTTGVPGDGPPPPEWWAPPTAPQEPAPPSWGEFPPPVEQGPRARRWPPRGRTVIAILVILAFVLGLGGGLLAFRNRNATPNAATSPPGSTSGNAPVLPSPSSDPSASLLAGLVLQQSDVGPTETVAPLPDGTTVSGAATLDLCNGTYPSESLRTARLQVVGVDDLGDVLLSTEGVLYGTPTDTAQAFSELTSVAAHCPSTPVLSPVGEPTVTTQFGAAPDASWPQVAGVQRLAFSFTSTDSSGNAQNLVAVYLRRGRALLGVYFSNPDPQAPVGNQTTMAGIVNLFANRMAQLPASAIGA
jgi:hypothetical protein